MKKTIKPSQVWVLHEKSLIADYLSGLWTKKEGLDNPWLAQAGCDKAKMYWLLMFGSGLGLTCAMFRWAESTAVVALGGAFFAVLISLIHWKFGYVIKHYGWFNYVKIKYQNDLACLLNTWGSDKFPYVQNEEDARKKVNEMLVDLTTRQLELVYWADREQDEDKKQRFMEDSEVCKAQFVTMFKAAEPFGLTKKTWDPYYGEALARRAASIKAQESNKAPKGAEVAA